jgi:hypothetical protein
MDKKLQEFYEAQFSSLNALLLDATPSELKFYEAARREFTEGYLYFQALDIKDENEILLSKRSQVLRGIFRLEYQLNSGKDDEFAKNWRVAELEICRDNLQKIDNEIHKLGVDVKSLLFIKPSKEMMLHEEKREYLNQKIEELKILSGLKVAQLERRGIPLEVAKNQPDIQKLEMDLEALTRELNQFIDKR